MKKELLFFVVLFSISFSRISIGQTAYYDAIYFNKNKPTSIDEDYLKSKLGFNDNLIANVKSVLNFYHDQFDESINRNELSRIRLDLLNDSIRIYTKRIVEAEISFDSINKNKVKDTLIIDALLNKIEMVNTIQNNVLKEMEIALVKYRDIILKPETDKGNQVNPLASYSSDRLTEDKSNPAEKSASKNIIISPSSGSFDLTTALIDATAQFLVDRVKKELTIAFFDKFKEKMDNIKELKALFPNTYGMLNSRDIFMVPSMGDAWVSAFQKDIKDIMKNFEKMVKTDDDYKNLANLPEYRVSLIIYHLIDMAYQGEHPATIINVLDRDYGYYIFKDDKISQCLSLLNVLSLNLRDTSKSENWIKFDNLKSLSTIEKKYFVGMLFQNNSSLFEAVNTKDKQNLKSLIKANTDDFIFSLEIVLSKFEEIKSSMEKIQKNKNVYLLTQDETIKEKQYQEYLQNLINYGSLTKEIIEITMRLKYFTNPQEYYEDDLYLNVLPKIENTLQIMEAVKNKQYGSVLISVLKLVEPYIDAAIKKNQDIGTEESAKKINTLMTFKKQFMFYGSFMVDIMTADSTVQLKRIIDKYAAPVGSYKVARKSISSGGLTAYPGLYGGYGTNFATKKSQSFVYGITAPIGFSFNWAISSRSDKDNYDYVKTKHCSNTLKYKKFSGHSFSLFVSVVDIGAAFCYRWTENGDSTKGFPKKIKFEQIFAPGFQLVWGVKNAPLVLMAGAQYTPLLRGIQNGQNVLGEPSFWRIGLTLAVDIPIFNFYHKTNKF